MDGWWLLRVLENGIFYTARQHVGLLLGGKPNSFKKISQEMLAYKSNLELSQVNRIELGKINTSISHIAATAEALDADPKTLFEFDIKR